jgi:hypothetical protein
MLWLLTAFFSRVAHCTIGSGVLPNITLELGSVGIGGMGEKLWALERMELKGSSGPNRWAQAVFGTEVTPAPPICDNGECNGNSHLKPIPRWCGGVGLGLLGLGTRLPETMLAPFRDSQISELSDEKCYGYQVDHEESESRWRYS